ncbi:DEAD/DEAH box helicase [Kutzneria viridogrisea]|uniref:ERCC4-related helicase n=1 Tax=Kutzneria viridogrisea TaxID=47990 RepID=A0ABR6BIX4_9PSEU|nr:ERCC4-related helicase [Kutzneria viridogrisea]
MRGELVAVAAGAIDSWSVGMRVQARDEEWVVSEVEVTERDGKRLTVTGISPLVREQRAVFFTKLDDVVPLRPEDTTLVTDDSPQFRRSRLYWEAVLRATPLPESERRLATVGTHLLDDLVYQREPARLALAGLRPRLLVADAVGLGKTLEIGLILAELIRRGRGERILVVTPRHILEQFQHELWCRFAIPLVRLDSLGIQRVRQKIPAGRNPFTYYKRAIISIDTLKSSQYRYALGNIEWDAVVIDESHKLVNVGAKNNELARILAPRTHALILASATPHNGKKESFGELISLLDPTAIPDTADYDAEQMAGLYVRRHKTSPDVDSEIGDHWKAREKPRFVYAAATGPEEAVFQELYQTWISPPDGESAPVTGKGAKLFPFTLLKAFLSSHAALAETIANRFETIAEDEKKHHTDRRAEKLALGTLRDLVAEVGMQHSAKLEALVGELKEIGIGSKSQNRVVIFSERRATLDFLRAQLPEALGFTMPAGAKSTQGPVRMLHGGLSDVEQQQNVKDFGLASSELRVLLTGDIAAEGVNLHRECHHLVHYDVPWSLITLEQRNGRIDRYGQLKNPQMRVLLHVRPGDDKRQDADFKVSRRLVEREDEVHRTFGDAAAVMGLHDEFAEERQIGEAFLEGRDVEEELPAAPIDDFEAWIAEPDGDGVGATEPVGGKQERYRELRLFPSTKAFTEAAFEEVYGDPRQSVGFHYDEEHEPELLTFQPAPDLQRRLRVLPEEYLRDHEVLTTLRGTFSSELAQRRLDYARQRAASKKLDEVAQDGGNGRSRGRHATKQQRADSSGWPDVTFLADRHPVIEWLVDKALARLARNSAPVIACAVAEPTVLIQGMYSNAQGRPTVLAYLAMSGLDGGASRPRFEDLLPVLGRVGVLETKTLYNTNSDVDPAAFQHLIEPAVTAARAEMRRLKDRQEDELMAPLHAYEQRLNAWRKTRESKAEQLVLPGMATREKRKVEKIATDLNEVMRSLVTVGEPMVRVLGVLVPQRNGERA